MKKSVELRKQLSALDSEIKTILDGAKAEKRSLNEDEQNKFNEKFDEAETLKRSIEDAEKVEAFEARQASKVESVNIQTKSKENYSILGHINAVRNGKVEGVYAEAQKEGEKELRNSGISPNQNAAYIPTHYQRDFSVGNDSGAKGGNFVQTDKGGIIESLFEGSLMEKVGASKLLGLTNNVDMPKGGSVVSTWRNETETNTKTDFNVGQVALRPNRLATRMAVSSQLITQTSESVNNYFRLEIEKSIQKAIDERFISNLLASTDVQSVVNGTDGGQLTYAKILEAISKVGKSEANMDNAKFLINWDVYNFLKSLPVASGSDKFVLADSKVDGFDYVVSNRVPSDLTKGSGTDLSAMAFGDFTSTIVAGFGAVEIITDPYTAAADGQIVLNVNSFWDIKDKYYEGKAVSKDIIA